MPGRRTWDYTVTWAAYTPKKIFISRRTARGQETETCRTHNARLPRNQERLQFSFQRSCLGNPRSLRVKVLAWDDQTGVHDRTKWSGWVRRG